jgi:hypothetical protein
MKKQSSKAKENSVTKPKSALAWKNRRELISTSIPLEVDLENRQLFFEEGVIKKLNLNFGTSNVDNLIKTYLDPKDLKKVSRSLTDAKNGIEKPISFNFIHPVTSRSFKFEYRYQIIYVKYSSTRLHGELIKVGSERSKKF